MLSLHGAGSASRGELRRPQLRWITLVLLAVVLDLVDGFWSTSLVVESIFYLLVAENPPAKPTLSGSSNQQKGKSE